MDHPQSSSQQSSLDSLRTVEFRQTLRGYHIDDVDDYLERVAVDAEALQEQHRQTVERLRQAAERIQVLEQQVRQLQKSRGDAPAAPEGPAPTPVAPVAVAPVPAVPVAATPVAGTAAPDQPADDALQRTLVLAQRFVEQTHAEAQAQAQALVAEAEAEAQAIRDHAEKHVRGDVERLEALRGQLSSDVERLSLHLEGERNRLRRTLTDMVGWLDEELHVAPRGGASGGGAPGGGAPGGAPAASLDAQATQVLPLASSSGGGTGKQPALGKVPERNGNGPGR